MSCKYYQKIIDLFSGYIKRTFKGRRKHVTHTTNDIWDMLASENKHDLISTLHHVERHDGGFRTIIVPDGGFSANTTTHKSVLRFLKKHKVNIFNVKNEVHHLKSALHQ